jgi:hypothetical protein
MRVAVCAERILGYDEWTHEGAVNHWKNGLHPYRPIAAASKGSLVEPPASFHQVGPDEMVALGGGHIVPMEDGYFDFHDFAMKSIGIPLTYRRSWDLHFGFSIDNMGSHSQRRRSIQGMRTDDGGRTFVQPFEGNVTIVVKCNQEFPEGQVIVEEVMPGPNVTVILVLKCPQKKKYYK